VAHDWTLTSDQSRSIFATRTVDLGALRWIESRLSEAGLRG
jgi:hypothetical protein